MICFRDRTFCPFYEKCGDGLACPRALTPQIIEKAKEWWCKDGAPIARFAEKPECFIKIRGKK